MKNIELKVQTQNFHKTRSLLKKLGAKHCPPLSQIDTYFHSPTGRLKIREINQSARELIYYQRPNLQKSKISTYKVIPLTSPELKIIKNVLNRLYTKWVVVKKARDLWLYKHTRIHLDKVQKLGNFIELETVANKISLTSAKREHKDIINQLQLSNLEKIARSYSDLLATKFKTPSTPR